MTDTNFQSVRLISLEKDEFDVSEEVVMLSGVVKRVLEEQRDEPIPLLKVKSATLKKILEFCHHYRQDPMNEIEKPLRSVNMNEIVQQWYADFVSVDQEPFYDLMLAANYMDIKPLLDLVCATGASLMMKKNPKQIRNQFSMIAHFTPDEEALVQEENEWCEDD